MASPITSLTTNIDKTYLATGEQDQKTQNSVIRQILENITNSIVPTISSLISRRAQLTSTFNTMHVASTGNDATADGSTGLPFRTITNAYNHLVSNFDFAGQTGIIQLSSGTYSFPVTGDSGLVADFGGDPINANPLPMVTLRGANPTDPTKTILDGGGSGSAIALAPGNALTLFANGITFQNFTAALSVESETGFVWLGNTTWLNNPNIVWGIESGGSLFSGSLLTSDGSNPTIIVGGTNDQLAFVGANSGLDLNAAQLIFQSTCTFSNVLWNVTNGGYIGYHSNCTSTSTSIPTGQQFQINLGGRMVATTINESSAIEPSAMPGATPGWLFNSGCFNNYTALHYTSATLPSGFSSGSETEMRAMVTNATTGATISIGTTVTSGPGAGIVAPAYWDNVANVWRFG